MIIQNIKQGNNDIRIENAESLEDAKKNNFRDGEYSRFFINNKPVQSYMSMVKFIVDETKRSGPAIIPNKSELINLRKQVIENSKKEVKKLIDQLKSQNREYFDESKLKVLDEALNKIDEYGVRVVE